MRKIKPFQAGFIILITLMISVTRLECSAENFDLFFYKFCFKYFFGDV